MCPAVGRRTAVAARSLSKRETGKISCPLLQGEYERLFGQWEGERISLVESTYKPWTTDKECGMVFAASKGLVMGDSALHMQELYGSRP